MALITLLFFLWGFARAILDVMNKHLQNELDISITQSSLIQVTTYLGYFTMAIPAGMFINRHGYRRGVVFGLMLFGLGALSFIPVAGIGNFYPFLVSLYVIGCGLTFLETSANPYVTELGPRATSASRLNLSQSFNGLGSMFATFVVGMFFFHKDETGGSVVVPYAVLGVVVLLVAYLFSRVDLPEIKEETPADMAIAAGDAHAADIAADILRHSLWLRMKSLFGKPLFVYGLFALLAYEVAEISINSYVINFLTGMHWMNDRSASMLLTGGLAFFMVGRFAGSWVMSRISAERALLVCSLGTVASIGLVLCDLGKVTIVGLMLNYAFEAILFPTIFSMALRGLGPLTKSASSLLMMTPVGGCSFLLMGLLADRTHMLLPFLVPMAGFVFVLSYAVCMNRKKVRDGQ